MKLGDIIRDCNVVENMAARTKEEAIAELVSTLVDSGDLLDDCREEVMVALLKREAAKPTDLWIGVAVPHTQVRCVDRVTVALGLSSEGIRFNGDLAHVILLIVSPEGDAPEHLKFLALISRLGSDPVNIASLRRARTRSRVFRIIKDAEDRISTEPPPFL